MNSFISNIEIPLLLCLFATLIILLLRTFFANQRIQKSLFETRVLLDTLKIAHEREQLKHIQLKKKKDQVEHTVNLGTKVVESVHRSITDTTFNVIDALASQERAKGAARKVQDAHNQAVGGVYNTIREVNKQVGGLANSLLKAGIKSQFKDKDDS